MAISGLLVVPAAAHDFWIQPSRFVTDRPGVVPVSFYVGHGSARERWGVGAEHVVLFKTAGPDGLVDRMKDLRLGQRSFDAIVPLAEPGAYVFGLQSATAESDLPAVRFDDYVATEGLTPIARDRKAKGNRLANGREIYSRRAKAIVQVGPVDAEDIRQVTRPANLKLEIVPDKHPLLLETGDRLPVRVLYNGKPLGGALVKLTDLQNDAEPVSTARTGAGGRIAMAIPRGGQWQMNVVWADVLTNNTKVDYATTFSSLSFETR
ncbi:DUF4198 domain-containing protein [Tsuneonella sp. HG222]